MGPSSADMCCSNSFLADSQAPELAKKILQTLNILLTYNLRPRPADSAQNQKHVFTPLALFWSCDDMLELWAGQTSLTGTCVAQRVGWPQSRPVHRKWLVATPYLSVEL